MAAEATMPVLISFLCGVTIGMLALSFWKAQIDHGRDLPMKTHAGMLVLWAMLGAFMLGVFVTFLLVHLQQ